MTVGFGGSIVLRHPIEEVFSLLTDPGWDTNWRYMQRRVIPRFLCQLQEARS